MYSYRYDPTTHWMSITKDGVEVEQCPITQVTERLRVLRASEEGTVITPTPRYFRADGTAVYQRERKGR
jgi:hypothetical protein